MFRPAISALGFRYCLQSVKGGRVNCVALAGTAVMQRLQPTRQPGAGIVRNQAKIWISTPLNHQPRSSQGHHGRFFGVCRWFGVPRTGKNAPGANLVFRCRLRGGRSREPAAGVPVPADRACLKMPLKHSDNSTRIRAILENPRHFLLHWLHG